jgi:hypothetical protein
MLNLPETKKKVCHEAGMRTHSFHQELDTGLQGKPLLYHLI